MTSDDILRMARETQLVPEWLELCRKDEEALGRFFRAAYAAGAAAEREACARVAETYTVASGMNGAPHIAMIFKDCATAIRAVRTAAEIARQMP